jgi:hypothetical protein
MLGLIVSFAERRSLETLGWLWDDIVILFSMI